MHINIIDFKATGKWNFHICFNSFIRQTNKLFTMWHPHFNAIWSYRSIIAYHFVKGSIDNQAEHFIKEKKRLVLKIKYEILTSFKYLYWNFKLKSIFHKFAPQICLIIYQPCKLVYTLAVLENQLSTWP